MDQVFVSVYDACPYALRPEGGRITSEKGLRLLADIERELEAGRSATTIGHGGELDWLRANLKRLSSWGSWRVRRWRESMPMGVFVFPSRTDTIGNVVIEAFASGVPALVTDACGPKFLIAEGVTGMVRGSVEEFARGGAELAAEFVAVGAGVATRTESFRLREVTSGS